MTITVTDTGPGIAPEKRDQLFQPFHQMDASIRSLYGGSGLGLSISKRLIELHGGRIGFNSEELKGSTFFIQLPMNSAAPVERGPGRWFNPYFRFEPRSHPFSAPLPAKRPRFLVMENGNVLEKLLLRYVDQVEIVRVASSQQALQELERGPAQAIFINDVSVENALKNMDSLNVAPEGVPVIICSMPGIEHTASIMGVSDYLVKPVSKDALASAVDRLKLKKHTVLIADDEEDILRLFRRMLVSWDDHYIILTAKDGKEAIRIMREKHPDAVILDLGMPQMDGFQLLAEKVQDPSICDIPVIVISARDPTGQPIVSKFLGFTHSGGLSLAQVLESISTISAVLSRNALNFGSTGLANPSDLPVSG